MLRVIACSGKVYFDLLEEREKLGRNDIYLLRVEQIYPFPMAKFTRELARFPNAELVWCQEEPNNMGAWTFVEPLLREVRQPTYAGRPAAAAPSVGSPGRHQEETARFLTEAFA